jgi:hypothetical protein
VNGLISKSHLTGYKPPRKFAVELSVIDSQTMGVIMPTILDLLYREYCRARLAEMRKQLLIAAERSEALDMHHQPTDQGDDERTDAQRKTGGGAPH